MYINNHKKLFEDLTSIHTIALYMGRIDDFAKDSLDDLISIIYYHKDELWDSNECGGEGSSLWDLADFEGMKDEKKLRKEMIADSNTLKRMWLIIQRELAAKYIVRCENCGEEYFYLKGPKYPVEKYRCGRCKEKNCLQLLTFEEWASPEILQLRSEYVH